MELRTKQAGYAKEGIRAIIKSEDIKKRSSNKIKLVPLLDNNKSFSKNHQG